MGEQRPERSEPLDRTSGDYSYDMAHDAPEERHEHHRTGHPHHAHGAGEVPPPDPDGDYSYDLAHEVPPAER